MNSEYQDWQDETVMVVKSCQGFYSIWPHERELPAGWEAVGVSGNKQQCLDWIKQLEQANPAPAGLL